MDYERFFVEFKEKEIEFDFISRKQIVSHKLSNEALFHLPLLAMAILLLSKSVRKPKSNELGQIIGECFERTFVGFKGSSQHLGWSANLRMRTVRALTFLETAKLVTVDLSDSRIKATPNGRKVIEKSLNLDSDLSYTLHIFERNYKDIQVEKKISMELG
ncbi:MAG: hypothetical protein HWE07_12175 [Cytophagia bacterium]|nr:hypothetical protein [Cytophagia bacterium]